jgi:hypothetical protein
MNCSLCAALSNEKQSRWLSGCAAVHSSCLRKRVPENQKGPPKRGFFFEQSTCALQGGFLTSLAVPLHSRFVFFGGWCVFIPGQSVRARAQERGVNAELA